MPTISRAGTVRQFLRQIYLGVQRAPGNIYTTVEEGKTDRLLNWALRTKGNERFVLAALQRKLTFPVISLIEKARDGQAIDPATREAFVAGYLRGEVNEAQLGAFIMASRLHDAPIPAVRGKEASFKSQAALKTSQKAALTRDEIFEFIEGCVHGSIPEFEVGGWLMAVRLNGFTDDETAYLSEAMWKTGGEIKLSSLRQPSGDKHAAGGSSDNTSFLIAPLLACFGVAVPMMSGRMLAHTGGTLDKLESIPGFRVNLKEEEVVGILQETGSAIFGQMETIAPADGLLYRLRQLTGTVQSVPLIAASIISKKLAEGANSLALVGTFGSGAFARDAAEAEILSRLMRNAALKADRKVTCFLVDMSQPLTPFIGPALEMAAAIRALRGTDQRFDRLRELSVEIAARILVMAGIYRAENIADARYALNQRLYNGDALQKFRAMVVVQGGDPSFVDDPGLFQLGVIKLAVTAPHSGFVQSIRADEIGNAVNDLGAGRTEQQPNIDHGVGVADLALVGTKVAADEIIGWVYARDEARARIAAERIQKAFTIGEKFTAAPASIAKIIL